MSRINFETKSKKIGVHGSERFHANSLMREITDAMLDAKTNQRLLLSAIDGDHHLHDLSDGFPWEVALGYALYEESSPFLKLDGKYINGFYLGLNTASTVGGDALKLMMRIHAQSELHGYVNGENRAWMAQIIEDAPDDVFRSGAGWDELAAFLRESDSEPVIMSFSVTSSVRDSGSKEWISSRLEERGLSEDKNGDDYWEYWNEEYENWDALESDEQWDFAVKSIFSKASLGLEIAPHQLQIAFGYNELTAGDLIEKLKNNTPNHIPR